MISSQLGHGVLQHQSFTSWQLWLAVLTFACGGRRAARAGRRALLTALLLIMPRARGRHPQVKGLPECTAGSGRVRNGCMSHTMTVHMQSGSWMLLWSPAFGWQDKHWARCGISCISITNIICRRDNIICWRMCFQMSQHIADIPPACITQGFAMQSDRSWLSNWMSIGRDESIMATYPDLPAWLSQAAAASLAHC